MQVNITYQPKYSRLELLLRSFFGIFYIAIPHGFLLFFYSIYTYITVVIGFIAALFTQRLPMFSYNAIVGSARWNLRVQASLLNLVDGYPAFGPNAHWEKADLQMAYPQVLTRLRVLYLIFLSTFMLIPHAFVLYFLQIGSIFTYIFAWFAVLITGNYPAGLHKFMVGVIRWTIRVNLYTLGVYVIYPDFTLDANPEDTMHV